MSRRENAGNNGFATVLTITLCFTMLAGSLVWLSRIVDQSLDDRANAAAIAFQAARAGAQALDVSSARSGVAAVDPQAARAAIASTTARLLAANDDTGAVASLSIVNNRVTVAVTITTTGRAATGTATASARAGVDRPLP